MERFDPNVLGAVDGASVGASVGCKVTRIECIKLPNSSARQFSLRSVGKVKFLPVKSAFAKISTLQFGVDITASAW